MTFIAAAVTGLAFVSVVSCTSKPTRETSIEASNVTPSAEELFVVGLFQVKKDPMKFIAEDHYGEELDLSARRPAVDLRGTIFETKYGSEDSKLIGNFYHAGQFYVARVPHRAVKNVHVQIEFSEPVITRGTYAAAHSLLRFELDRPLVLVAPMPSSDALEVLKKAGVSEQLALLPEPMTGPETEIRNVNVSAEAQWVKDDKFPSYERKRALLGAYTRIVRFMSQQTRFEEFYETGKTVNQIRFVPRESGDVILSEALKMSEREGLTKLHDDFWYGCTTVPFEIIERAEGSGAPGLALIKNFMQGRVPVTSIEELADTNGVEVMPVELDPSLLDESEEAYQDKIAMKKRELCPDDFETGACENLKSAVSLLKKAGRI